MTSPTNTQRTFQREWLEEIGTTIETFITNSPHRQRERLIDLMPQYLNAIRVNVYPENEDRLKVVEQRLRLLNS